MAYVWAVEIKVAVALVHQNDELGDKTVYQCSSRLKGLMKGREMLVTVWT